MRIAILTLPLHTNYGGILQAYALQTVLERMGHEVELLEPARKRMHHPLLMPLVWVKRGIRKYIRHENVEIFRSAYERVNQYTEPFIINNIHRRIVSKWNSELASQYDAIVVGSDQVWRPKYCFLGHTLEHAFLDFAIGCNIKRIAYAASFGTAEQEYTREMIEKYKPLIHKFNFVSVREDSGMKLCTDYFDIKASHVLDPTLLLTANDYRQLLKGRDLKRSTGSLFVYILDDKENAYTIIQEIASKKGLKPFMLNFKFEQYNLSIDKTLPPSVEQWLQSFIDADIVVTDSFHACVFSILFRKPFYIIENESRGMTRINSLLRLVGINKDLIIWHGNISNHQIDWNRIHLILKIIKTEDCSLLKQTIYE